LVVVKHSSVHKSEHCILISNVFIRLFTFLRIDFRNTWLCPWQPFSFRKFRNVILRKFQIHFHKISETVKMILWSAIMQCSLLHIKKNLSCSWINLLHVSSSLTFYYNQSRRVKFSNNNNDTQITLIINMNSRLNITK
jgi:hypothetical protein